MRLQLYLARCGVASRRKAEACIESGLVTVNGRVVIKCAYQLAEGDKVAYRDLEVKLPSYQYIKLYKPRRCISAHIRQGDDPTVFDLLRAKGVTCETLNIVGRLDKDSEGLLVLTNDGDLLNRLTHPSFEVPKVYEVTLDKEITAEDQKQALKGVKCVGEHLQCDLIKLLDAPKGTSVLQCYLHEGKKRHLRRLFAELGYTVKILKRTNLGPFSLGKLRYGEFEPILPDEIIQIEKRLGI
ncbi:hypothetical protein AUK40_00835 [Candidatus Wirthbacteria bacterium CG2_30_54_11]|uniref:Pseudouridine synthase n=1 Tax=Candidatus Wirthbacteria bacterium CG2_30_54_11 TaxID=1817892 RepID=A0A1J5J173_9BACT|nr:MAG: hypothetical protein AUK40_00835 [Candidatus Wirthbacteria bacterium CG2_30_54_11]